MLGMECEGVLDLAKEQFAVLAEWVCALSNLSKEHGDVEQHLQREGAELLRRLFQAHLDSRAQHEEKQESVTGSDGEVRAHRRSNATRKLETIFGSVDVRRIEYSTKEPGVPSIYLGDASLNLSSDKYSDGLRCRVAEEASRISFEETATTIAATTAGFVAKRQCEELVVKVAEDFDDFYATRSVTGVEDSSNLLVMTTDGKGIVMHMDDLRSATAKAAKESEHKMQTRLSAGEKRNRKRMATVASIYSVERNVRTPEEIISDDADSERKERPRVLNKRVWASVERDQQDVISDLFDEARRRDPRSERETVILVDGNPQQLGILKGELKQRKMTATIVLDFIHVLEYLWKAVYVFHAPGTPEAEDWVKERALNILRGQASQVAAGMRRSATLQGIPSDKRKPVDTCAEYLLNHTEYLRYDDYLSKGYPIATGVIEGACRHLVADRMDITGARWRLERAEAVLKIRSLRASGDFQEYWNHHKRKEFIRNHASKLESPEMLLAA